MKQLTKQPDEIFCPSCGKAIKKEAEFCIYCGVRQKVSGQVIKKSKTTAILLAVFLGAFAWLYCWRIDYWKFWVGLAIALITYGYGGVIVWIWAVVDMAVRPKEFYENYT